MKRLKVIFSLVLLLLALPVWRNLDLLTWIWASETLYSAVFFIWGIVFLVIPSWLFKPKLLPIIVFVLVIAGTLTSYKLGPLSHMATNSSSNNHCGKLTYTGMFYPALNLLTQAHADDLEARNQLCWIKKMIQRVPAKFDDKIERDTYLKLTQIKLLDPHNKFRVSLPMIALLYGVIFSRYSEDVYFEEVRKGRLFLESLKFWIDQYTVEISMRDYSWINFPHGPYIKFEYGIVEKNWEKIINSLILDDDE